MSLLPMFLREFAKPLRMMEQQMKYADEFFRPTFGYYMNQPRLKIEYPEMEKEAAIEDKEKFQVQLNMQDFKPENITVKTVDGNTIEVEAKHEEKHDDNKGFVLKHLVRRFVLPQGHDIQKAYSTLSSEGVLTIITPKSLMEERAIPISHETSEESQKKEISN